MNALKEAVRPTVFVVSRVLNNYSGSEIVFANEAFQHTGSFKFRAAYNLVSSVPEQKLLAASSGNFGMALAHACLLLKKHCTIVMPSNSSRVKVEGVRYYGGTVVLVDLARKTRAERVQELAAADPAMRVVSAYDDPFVIEGNASLGDELSQVADTFDIVIVPVGGGGLLSGVITGLQRNSCQKLIYGAEPLIANDAARSLREGKLIANESEPQSIADGARTLSLGKHTWAIIKDGATGIVEVSESLIHEATKVLFTHANVKAEPTGALALGAVLARPDLFSGKRVCCIISGGNVDAALFFGLIARPSS
jgi:threonine dehydratase